VVNVAARDSVGHEFDAWPRASSSSCGLAAYANLPSEVRRFEQLTTATSTTCGTCHGLTADCVNLPLWYQVSQPSIPQGSVNEAGNAKAGVVESVCGENA